MSSVSSTGGSDPYAALRAQLFQKADTDKSGGISLDEFKALGSSAPSDAPDAATVFSQIDTDGDGQVTEAELSAFKPPQVGGISQLSSDTSQALLDILSQADTDGNGTLSLDEFKALGAKAGATDEKAAAVFAKVDTNKDGEVSSDELNTAVAAVRPHGHHGGPPPVASADSSSDTSSDTDNDEASIAETSTSSTDRASVTSDSLAKLIEQYLANYASGSASSAQGSLASQLA